MLYTKSLIYGMAALAGSAAIGKKVLDNKVAQEDSARKQVVQKINDFRDKEMISFEEALAVHATVDFTVKGIPGTWIDPVHFGDLFIQDTAFVESNESIITNKNNLQDMLTTFFVAQFQGFEDSELFISLLLEHLNVRDSKSATSILKQLPREHQQDIFNSLSLLMESIRRSDDIPKMNHGLAYNIKRLIYEAKRPRSYDQKQDIKGYIRQHLKTNPLKTFLANNDILLHQKFDRNLFREALWLEYLQLLEGGNSYLIDAKYEPPEDISFKGRFVWSREPDSKIIESIWSKYRNTANENLFDRLQSVDFEKTGWFLLKYASNNAFDAMGMFSARLNEDQRGRYIEFYDLWDLHPAGKDKAEASKILPNAEPIGLYHRIYVDDICDFVNQLENKHQYYKHLSFEHRNDKKIAAEAMRFRGNLLQYASEELKNDKEVVLAAVTQSGHVLEYASKELQDDREVVLEAIKNSNRRRSILQYASSRLQQDPELIRIAST